LFKEDFERLEELTHLEELTQDAPQLYVRIEVIDEGPGLSTADKLKLFGKFARLSARPTGGEDSTGLGLAIVKTLVEAMRGRVWCESELGKGATFVVELPSA
jgi:signal transduction histidine kinase